MTKRGSIFKINSGLYGGKGDMAGRETGELMHPNVSERFLETPFWFGNKASSISLPQVPRRSQEDK